MTNSPDPSTTAALTSCGEAKGRALLRRQHGLALAAVLLLAAFLHFFQLEQEGYGNLYYAAAVRSQLGNWHNFFFNSFDPGGFVTVDKPPLGLWVQVGSAALLGFSGLGLLLPQAFSGLLSVLLLFHLVRRTFGPTAGLLAALALAVTPICVAANRNNTMDGLLVLVLLLAAWATLLAAEQGRLPWLLLSAFLVGVGFNIKMLQAYMVLPAFYLLYLLAPLRFWKRLLHLALATVVLVAVSLSWAVAVDLTPEEERPYIGSSRSNAVMELIIGHNGMTRLFPGGLRGLFGGGRPPQPPPGGAPPAQPPAPRPSGWAPLSPPTAPGGGPLPGGPPSGGVPFSHETGEPGWLRLFNRQLGGQTSWLLPLAGLGFLAAFWQAPMRRPLDRRHLALFLWALWLLPQVVFFSIANLFHRYYLEMLSPAIAALVGAGLAAMWEDFRRPGWRGWLLPTALVATAMVEAGILADFPGWAWLIPLVVGLTLSAAVVLVVLRFLRHARLPAWTGLTAACGILALLIAPTVWALIPVLCGGHAGLPYAGPDLLAEPRPRDGGIMQGRQGGDIPPFATPLADYLLAHRMDETFIVATVNANTAAPLILITGEPVMAMGGFSGGDPILNVEGLLTYIRNGEVRFFYLAPRENRQAAFRWVVEHCRRVPEREWAGKGPGRPTGGPESPVLFDCRAIGRAGGDGLVLPSTRQLGEVGRFHRLLPRLQEAYGGVALAIPPRPTPKTEGEEWDLPGWIEVYCRHEEEHAATLVEWRRGQEKAQSGPKPLLLAALTAGREELLAAAAELVPSEERSTRPVCGVWTLQDVFGHIADWEAYIIADLRDMAAGRTRSNTS